MKITRNKGVLILDFGTLSIVGDKKILTGHVTGTIDLSHVKTMALRSLKAKSRRCSDGAISLKARDVKKSDNPNPPTPFNFDLPDPPPENDPPSVIGRIGREED